MKSLKSSIISLSAVAIILAGSAAVHAQVAGGTVTKYRNADGTETTIVTSPAFTAGQTVVASNAIPANYMPGYYNYSTSYALPTSTTSYPGVPNTGGTVVIPTATATYIAPSVSWNSMGMTGGISIPAGYTAAVGPGGAILTTGNATAYPGVPNTGGTAWSANNLVNGQAQVTGIVTIVTPTALGLNNGGQTWTIGWNGSSASGQIFAGDTIEVYGTPDTTFSSKINATSIRILSR